MSAEGAALPAGKYSLISAEDGEAGLEKLKSEKPDLVILDLMMPKLDGYMLAKLIRDNPRTRAISILAVSALREMSRLFTATVQVDGFLTKPFAPEDLIGSVAKILEKRRAQA